MPKRYPQGIIVDVVVLGKVLYALLGAVLKRARAMAATGGAAGKENGDDDEAGRESQ